MDVGSIAQRFPLVARPRPPCVPLVERIRQIEDLARTAEEAGDPTLAAAAQNKAALTASDCGLPELATTICWRHFDAHQDGWPLDARAARLAVEPLVNLARLLIREGDGRRAHHLLETLFQAVAARTETVIDDRHVSFWRITRSSRDHRTLCEWLWTILLADGTRALATAGRWQEAQAHAERHKGIGHRLLDGRQVAIVAHLLADDPAGALTLLQRSTLAEPWEHAVMSCLAVLCQTNGAQPVGLTSVTSMVERYLNLKAVPELAVFHTRLAMTVIDIAAAVERLAVADTVLTRLLRETMAGEDGYAARDVLAHNLCLARLPRTDQRLLSTAVQFAGLDRGSMPDDLRADLMTAVDLSAKITARSSPLRVVH